VNEYVKVEGQQLAELLEYLRAVVDFGVVDTLRVSVDGGLKIKVNQFSWTAPYGVVHKAE
jgi:hypothetical protein